MGSTVNGFCFSQKTMLITYAGQGAIKASQ